MNTTLKAAPAATAPAGSGADIADWRPEDDAFWESTGKKIAYRNLWISVPALLCGFAIWGMWGIITVQMLNLGFPFTQAELFSLTAIAGLAGATMRIVLERAKPVSASAAGGFLQRLTCVPAVVVLPGRTSFPLLCCPPAGAQAFLRNSRAPNASWPAGSCRDRRPPPRERP